MKKINVLIIAVLAFAAAFMTSCKNDNLDAAAPTITFENGDQTVMANSDVAISGDIYAAGEIKQIVFFKDNASFGDPITKGFDTDTTTHFSMNIPGDQVTETFTFEIQVTDKNDKIGKGSVTITVQQGDPVVKFSGLKMYCASADETGDGDYASLTIFHTWNHYQAKNYPDTIAVIDVWYYNGNYTKDLGGTPHLVSPDTKTTTIITHNGLILPNAKATKLRVLTSSEAADFSDWTNINDDYLINNIDMSNGTYNVGGFAQGDIIAFELQDGKKGVMKAVGGTAGSNPSDYIIVDVIVQEQAPVK
ncbi:MAG: hypothetical protein L3J56_06860 [Bacteroidales bacterium]|nr:hypothetical protein [Bacteroidales bacterium]